MPRFSIIITCYNQCNVIAEAIDSALAQSCSDKEIIVVDDCSTDSSIEILKKYGGAITFVASKKNQGAPGARNQAAAVARGDFLVFLDGDDRLLPWALDVYSRVADRDQPKLILATMYFFRGLLPAEVTSNCPREIKAVGYEDYFSKDRAYRASASAMIVERKIFNSVGGWTEGTFPADDQDLLLKLGCAGPVVQITAPPTSAYRFHEGNATRSVLPLVGACHYLLSRERQGYYPGGRERRLERHAVVGGFAFFMVKRAWQSHLYPAGFRLLAAGWPMVSAAILRRCIALLRGRHAEETRDGLSEPV